MSYLRLSKEDLYRSGNSPHAIKWPEDMGGGYMGSLEIVYHVHCLNLLRQSLFPYYQYYKNDRIFDDPKFAIEERLGKHLLLHPLSLTRDPEGLISGNPGEQLSNWYIDSCLDILRQRLMCDADSSPMAFYWIKGYPRPYPNFNTWHKCRNYDELQDWAAQRHVDRPSSWEALRMATPESDIFDKPPTADMHPRPAGY